ncbi:MAG: hypothetical protein U0894_10115 [Pirellulales bacterium]
MSAGAAEGAADAANLLKPALARGELQLHWCYTTLDEYRKHVEKDAALERRFQPVMVGEPSVEDTLSILRGLKPRYEAYHGVKIKDLRLWLPRPRFPTVTSPTASLPDKAIDLMDEAASKLAMNWEREILAKLTKCAANCVSSNWPSVNWQKKPKSPP